METFVQIASVQVLNGLLYYIIAHSYQAFLELISFTANCVLLLSSGRMMIRAVKNEKARQYLGSNGPTALLSYQQLYHALFKLILVPLLFIPWWIGLRAGIVHPIGQAAVISIAIVAAILSVLDEITAARLEAMLRPDNHSLRSRLDDVSRRNQNVS